MGRRKEDGKDMGKIKVGMGWHGGGGWKSRKASRSLLEAVGEWSMQEGVEEVMQGGGDRESGACKVCNGDLAGEGKKEKREKREKSKMRGHRVADHGGEDF